MNPKVSVIIPNYNYEKFIAKTIESVLTQTYRHLEIIVVDDGSKDNSAEVLKQFGDKIRVIFQKNAGVAAARNHGVSVSTGDYVAFLDADDMWLPEKIEKQLKKFETDSQIGLVHCSMTLINPQDEPIGELNDGQEGFVAEEFLCLERGVVVGAGSTALVKRKVFDETGGFDLRLSTVADWDFSYQVARRHKIGFIAEPLVLYRMHGKNMHSNIRVMEKETLIGFEKAFSEKTPKLEKIKNKAYGNLHKVLAGSYFYAGNYRASLRNATKSICFRPLNFTHFIQFPIRALRKKLVAK